VKKKRRIEKKWNLHLKKKKEKRSNGCEEKPVLSN
jgi:hypothetical protein